jgi:hypothetical protein
MINNAAGVSLHDALETAGLSMPPAFIESGGTTGHPTNWCASRVLLGLV